MDKRYFTEILSYMSKTIAEHDFRPVPGEEYTYKNDAKAFRIFYDGKSFCLELADVEDGNVAPYKKAASWLFGDDHTEKDTLVIAEDFENTVLSAIGAAPTAAKNGEVALPGKNAAGATPGIEALTAKMLAIYPECKDIYKEEVARNGEFLYADFFLRHIVPRVRQTVSSGGKKQISKVMDILGKMYYEGDSTVSNVVVSAIIAGTFYDRPDDYTKACEYLGDYPLLKDAGAQILKFARRKRKYAEFLKA